MNHILQWDPEKSRLWANAKIENIHHLRQDLSTLAEWIQAKAESAALTAKADLSKVNELEKLLASTRAALESLRQEAGTTNQNLSRRLDEFDQFTRSAAESFDDCRRAEESVKQGLADLHDHAATVARHLTDAQAAAGQAVAAKQETSETVQKARETLDEFTRSWDLARQKLDVISADIEHQAAETERLAQSAQQALTECEVKAQAIGDLQVSFEAQQTDSTARLTDLLRQTESQAMAASEHARLTASASDLANSLKAQCEALLETLHLKSEELASSWQAMEKEFTSLSQTAREHAAAGAGSARACQEFVEEAQETSRATAELRGSMVRREEELNAQLSSLSAKLEQTLAQVTAAGTHAQACQKVQAQIAQTDAQLKSLAQRADEQTRAFEQKWNDFRKQTVSLGGRLKWLLFGNGQ